MNYKMLEEFMRRLAAEGYEFTHSAESGAGTVYRDGRQIAVLEDDGSIAYKAPDRAHALFVRNMRDEVAEYMTEYEKAAPDKTARTLLLYANCELAAYHSSGGNTEFVTWQRFGNDREVGHYFNDYTAAKEDFAIRAGLVDVHTLFSETELTVIRSGLSYFLDTGTGMTRKREKEILGIVEKIDEYIVPRLTERAERSEEQSFESEIEL
jgi:hypothetical protein